MILNGYGAFNTNIIPTNPTTSPIEVTQDSSYGMYVRLNDLAAGENDEFAWYYAAGPASQIDSIISEVTSAAAVDSAAPAPGVIEPTEGQVATINPLPITGTGTAGDTISIYDGLGFLLVTGTVDGSGSYTIIPPTFLQ